MFKGYKGRSWGAVIAIVIAIFFWGLTPVAIRYVVGYLSPPHLLILRFSLSALLFVPFLYGFRRDRWTRGDVLRVIGCGIAGVAGYNVPVTYGSQWVPAGITGLLIATEPIWIVLISMILLGERPRWTLMLGLVVAGTGIVMLLGFEGADRSPGGSFLLGVALILLGALMWAVYCILIPPLARRHGALLTAAMVQILGLVPLYTLWDSELVGRAAELHARAWGAVAFLALCATVISIILWNYGVGRLGSTRAGVFLYLIPPVSVLGGAVALGEHVTAREVLSGVMIVAGVVAAQARPVAVPAPAGAAEGEGLT